MTVINQVQDIALNLLALSPRNMRKTKPTPESVADLVAHIAAQGAVLQNLCVYPERKGKKLTGRYEVIAGGRRLLAAQILSERGDVPADWPISCRIVSPEEAEDVTLAENYARLPSHPADTYEAFAALSAKGHGDADIAARYGIEPIRVTRTLRLAKVSPRLVEMFRRDELTGDHMAALTLTDDHDLQERVTLLQGGRQIAQPWQIKKALTSAEISTASDHRAKFIDLEAYKAAGGAMRVDLFSKDDEAYLSDSGLVERLALAKLETLRPEIEAEGWGWVEVATTLDYQTRSTFDQLHPETVPLPADAVEEIAGIDAELEALYESCDVDEDEALSAQAQALEARRDALSASQSVYNPAKMALAGAYIAIDSRGQLQVWRGLVKPAQKKALAALDAGLEGQEDQDEPDGRPSLSAALVERLTAHRTLALRARLIDRPDVALVATVHALLLATHYAKAHLRTPLDSPLQIKGRQYNDPDPYKFGDDLEGSPADSVLNLRQAQLVEDLPEDPADLWDYLAPAGQLGLMGLLAYATAQTLCAVELGHSRNPRRQATLDKMQAALELDMADWWAPTADGYFSKVSKAQTLEAIGEGASPDLAKQLSGLKKGELAAEAQKRLAGSRWLPAMLRTPVANTGGDAAGADDIEDDATETADPDAAALDQAA